MNTLDQIKKTEQRLARLERSSALKKIKQRKRDTRKKIELGGLVIKSGMENLSKDVILGALLDAKTQIDESETQKRIFELKGKNAFLGKE